LINIYTLAQVQSALLRAQVAMLLISQNISKKFYYLNTWQYDLYKRLQYDIYCLFSTITNETGFISFNAIPDQYEQQYYSLVGAMIEKTKTVDVYGAYGGSLNPNYQSPSQTVIAIPVIAGFNSGVIGFTTNGPFVLNYSGLASLYGNNPSLAVYTIQGGIEQEDEQTAPIIARTGAGTGSPISTITLDYPPGVDVTGYILISGFTNSTGGGSGGGGGGSGAITLTFTDANLLQDGNGSWYLPFTPPPGLRPFYVESNGVQVTTLFDDTFSPNRIYGFANNDTQIILVKII
jgi:hypothetical protein